MSTTEISPKFSMPRILLSLEGLTLFIGSIVLYAYYGGTWWLFLLLLLSPDLAMLGYLLNTRIGAMSYNLIHTTVLPLSLAIASLLLGWTLGLQLALIWFAHIGMDRTVGYGLKYSTNFKETHLNRV
jgi:hypothetical protein